MVSKTFFREFENYLKDNGVELKYTHNDEVLNASDYETFFKLIYQFAHAQSILTGQDVDMSRWARMNYNIINPTITTEKKLEEINKLQGRLIPLTINSIMDCFNDNNLEIIL